MDSEPGTLQADFDEIPDETNGLTGSHNAIDTIVSFANSKEDYRNYANVTVHEMIHAMDVNGFRKLPQTYPDYEKELTVLYHAALQDANTNKNSKWRDSEGNNSYEISDNYEFVAHIVGSFYGSDQIRADSAEDFKINFPNEYEFVKKYYGEKPDLVIPDFLQNPD